MVTYFPLQNINGFIDTLAEEIGITWKTLDHLLVKCGIFKRKGPTAYTKLKINSLVIDTFWDETPLLPMSINWCAQPRYTRGLCPVPLFTVIKIGMSIGNSVVEMERTRKVSVQLVIRDFATVMDTQLPRSDPGK